MELDSKPDLLHVAYGNEEETMLSMGAPNAKYAQYTEAYDFVGRYANYIPESIATTQRVSGGRFMQNGGLVYSGGAKEGGANLERATPECASAEEFARYVSVNELLAVKMIGSYIKQRNDEGFPLAARWQRRVVDGIGNTRASHDSIQVHDKKWLENFKLDPRNELLLMAHIATRSCITGAGYVTASGWKLGQKVQHTNEIDQYGFVNSVYRRVNGSLDDTGARLEIRCNDINLSPWALKQRIGTSAMLLAAMQTPLKSELFMMLPEVCHNPTKKLKNLRRYNSLPTDEFGTIKGSARLHNAIDTQERMYTIFGAYLPDLMSVSDENMEIIEEGVRYCQDLRKVLHGDEDIKVLTDRSDYATKFLKIRNAMIRDREIGIDREATDMIAMMHDMKYDCVTFTPKTSGGITVDYGYGYRYREDKRFRNYQSPDKVEHALYNPPEGTRAYYRGKLIKSGEAIRCEWNQLALRAIDEPYENLSGEILNISDVMITDAHRKDIKHSLQQYLHRY